MVADGERPEASGPNATPAKAPHDAACFSGRRDRFGPGSIDASSPGQFVLTQTHVTLLIECHCKQPIMNQKPTPGRIHMKQEVADGKLHKMLRRN